MPLISWNNPMSMKPFAYSRIFNDRCDECRGNIRFKYEGSILGVYVSQL